MKPGVDGRPRRFGAFELDAMTGELTRAGRRLHLPPQAVKILVLLTGRPGELVTRDEIRTHLWGDDTFVEFESAMNACVSQIRTVLGDRATTPRFIETLPRRGYRFVAPVTQAEQPPSANTGSLGGGAPAGAPGLRMRAIESRRWVAMTAVLILLSSTLVWLARDRTHALEGVRFAVLPIDAPPGDDALQSLAAILQERTLVDLFNQAGLSAAILARPAVEHLRGEARTVDGLRQLELDFWVDASLHRLPAGRVRLHTKVARQTDFRILSAQDYVQTYESFLENRERVGAELAHRLISAATRTGMPDKPADLAARDIALSAAGALDRGGRDAVAAAVDRLQQAAVVDPTCNWTRGLLARALARAAAEHVLPAREALARARQEAHVALRTEPGNADALTALGATQLWMDRDLGAAGASLKRAASAPGATWDARLWYADWLEASGRTADAEAARAAVLRDRPLTAAVYLRAHRTR